jgi:tetratricopeptide (TPR) repeat protein
VTNSLSLLELTVNGEYHSALAVFKGIDQPSPEELRWAAVCFYNLQGYLQAKDLLELAQARGCLGATIELATVLRFLGQPHDARVQLDGVNFNDLSDHDKALERRERGLLEYIRGDFSTALRLLEEAWLIVRQSGLSSIQSAIAQTLGFLFANAGKNQHAMYYLDHAMKQTNSTRAARIYVTRANCLIGLGKFSDAEADLSHASQLLERVPALSGVFSYTCGILAKSQNRLDDALNHFECAIKIAFEPSEVETEFYAQLQVAAILTTQKHLELAGSRLMRAQALVASCGPKGKALHDVRKGVLLCSLDQPDGFELLELACSQLADLQLWREVLVANLNLAEMYLCANNKPAALKSLRVVDNCRIAQTCTPALGELMHLPQTLAFLLALPQDHTFHSMVIDWSSGPEVPPFMVELVTLGSPELRVNGKRIGLELTGTIELIAYLLLYPDRTRDEILGALFATKGEKRAANYFHQAKLTLQRATTALEVRYNQTKKTYGVYCDVPLFLWDAIELQKVLSSAEEIRIFSALKYLNGTFIPGSESDWVIAEREKLSWLVFSVGLESLETLSKCGEYLKCLELAKRLRELEPLHPVVAEYLVIATHSLEGKIAARQTLLGIEREFEREVGEVPDVLVGIRSKLGLIK